MKKIKYIKLFIPLTIFAIYWIITVFINIPESSIVAVENFKTHKKLSQIMFQKWSFFAPPPTYNLRLNYYFISTDSLQKIVDIEIFEELGKKIRSEFPFNETSADLQWILYNNVTGITDEISIVARYKKLKLSCLDTDTLCTKQIEKACFTAVEYSAKMYVLIRHAKNLAKKLKLDNNYRLKIIVSTIDIPKYAERYTKQKNVKINFISKLFNFKTNKWEE